MGIYINPGNDAFKEIADSDYVDKTGLISLINSTIEKKNKLTCISRPRRFGKSWAARMLTAYYDRSCDSHELFDDKVIAKDAGYGKYLNSFNVIYLDITSFTSEIQTGDDSLRNIPERIRDALLKDLKEAGFPVEEKDSLNDNIFGV